MRQQAAEQQQQQQQQAVQQVRDLCLAPQHAAAQQQAQHLHQQQPLLCHKQQQQQHQQQHQQAPRMRSPFLQAQLLQDGTAFDTLAAQLLDALGQCHATPGVQMAQQAYAHAHSARQQAALKQQQQQQQGMACTPHPLLPPTAAAAAATAPCKSGTCAKSSPLGANLQHWGSLLEEDSEAGTDADAHLPADADCAALLPYSATVKACEGATAAPAAAAAAAAVSRGDSAVSLTKSASDEEHHCEVRALLESCLTEAAERARSESTQDSSAIASGLLLLREDSSLCSSCSISGAMTESGAVAIDWDAMLRSELFEAGFNGSNTDMHAEVLQPTAPKQTAAAAEQEAV